MVTLTPLTGVLGAEISGLRLGAGWDSELIASVRAALREHKVVVIRDQGDLSAEQLVAFTREFGSPETREHPLHGDVAGLPEIKVLRSDGDTQETKSGDKLSWGDLDGWHTDGSVRQDTNHWISFLFANRVPAYGRDTLFADMEAAYERLSEPVRRMLDGLIAIHAWPRPTDNEGFAPVTHPVALLDPETGRRSLYVNQGYTKEIVGLRPDESKALLGLLFEQAHRPQIQLRVVWKPGTLTIWDNRRTQHFAIMDSPGAREMYRVMVTPAA